jgi:hypothetical protein
MGLRAHEEGTGKIIYGDLYLYCFKKSAVYYCSARR